ncbi:uncharacterized protein G2W53_024801 [Senna tora]|uniref:Uncharacterized protein n=1 Tax=Senna tora TaxID=362788 RepID=A0A834TDT6_9FABA|nr:uncharacterized protein G2W53_024801 [Senna tora]
MELSNGEIFVGEREASSEANNPHVAEC